MKTNKYSPTSLQILLITFLLLTSPIAALSKPCEELLKGERYEMEEYNRTFMWVTWDKEKEFLCSDLKYIPNFAYFSECNQRKYLFWNSDGLNPPEKVQDKSGKLWSIDIVDKRGRPTENDGNIQIKCKSRYIKDADQYQESIIKTSYGKVRINKDEKKPSYLPHLIKFKVAKFIWYEVIKADF
mgnify:CR=1 FL=1